MARFSLHHFKGAMHCKIYIAATFIHGIEDANYAH
jgi:hypothetical protein